MDELREQYAQAKKIDVVSAEELDKHDTAPYKMGGLLITAVFLKDVGLIGRNRKVPQHDEADTYAAENQSEALAAPGLPSSFGSQSKKAPWKPRGRKQSQAAAAIPGLQGSGSSCRKPPPPGFHAPNPQGQSLPCQPPGFPRQHQPSRPETTGLLPDLPTQGGIHTYFHSTDSSSSNRVPGGSAESLVGPCDAGAVQGDGEAVGAQALTGRSFWDSSEEVTSALCERLDSSSLCSGGRVEGVADGSINTGCASSKAAGAGRKGQKGEGEEGGEEGVGVSNAAKGDREKGAGVESKKKKEQVWHELQGDEASEAREATLKKAKEKAMALLPEAEKQGTSVVMDPSLAAHIRSIVPRNVFKYWLQRYSLFTKYDNGIQLDTEGWWSVTPEILATHQSSTCKRYSRGHIAMDAMAGCAGNAIQLTKDFSLVYAVEISKRRADMARHNAEIYGVGSQLEVLCTDFFKAAPLLFAEAIFVSPPWGGPNYKRCDTFEVLETVEGMASSIKHLILTALNVVGRSTLPPKHQHLHKHHGPSPLEAFGSRLCAGVRLLAATAPSLSATPMHLPPPPIPRFVSGTFDLAPLEVQRAKAAAAGPCQPSTTGSSAPPPSSSSLASGSSVDKQDKTQGVVAVFLPRNTDLKQLEMLVPDGSVWHLERNYVNGRLKGISLYCFSTPPAA